MNTWLSAGVLFVTAMVLFILMRWPFKSLRGTLPTSNILFIAILFTSGLDVGLIMFPLTEFPMYADVKSNPEYSFTNPLAIIFGFWGFLVWAIYFLTCFYFCALEPKVRFFQKKWVNRVYSMVIVGTCAFTAYLLLANLPDYLPELARREWSYGVFIAIVLCCILLAVYSSTQLRYVKILSIISGILFLLLTVGMAINGYAEDHSVLLAYRHNLGHLGDYFANIQHFLLPMNDYHAFYLAWWFAWSIMIGQFSARFVGTQSTCSLLLHILFWPSLSIGLWFSVLYVYFKLDLPAGGMVNLAMVLVGIVFVVNSLDSLLRLYADNLQLTTERLGKGKYIALHTSLLSGLVALFSFDFLQIEWIGAFVIAVMVFCFFNLCYRYRQRIVTPQF